MIFIAQRRIQKYQISLFDITHFAAEDPERAWDRGCQRLGDTRERLIDEAIERRYLVRPRTPLEEVYRNVKKRCRELSIPAPARGSVLARIRALDARHVARRRLGSKEAQAIARSTPGELEASTALELIQMDALNAERLVGILSV